jgi:cell fate regulator YaaT (PSP1 superfamily)
MSEENKNINTVKENGETEIVGVRFKEGGKMYYFAPNSLQVQMTDYAIVETARGMEFGKIVQTNKKVPNKELVLPLRPVIRIATTEDIKTNEQNKQKEEAAMRVCQKKVEAHGLELKLIEAEYTFDNSKLTFYFTADGRIDFRELVKDLASTFKTRIELRQIGIRDEAKFMGGLGVCGRPFCCNSFLPDFCQVSIKMAKEQNLSLNSSKISGACGRLMCCLKFEHETYAEEIKKTPPVDATVKTRDGEGVITEINPLRGLVKVKIGENIKQYHRDEVKVISLPKKNKNDDNEKFDMDEK